MEITVNQNVAPTFTQVAPICAGAPLNALPTRSNNDLTGTWLPELDNSATTVYTFTPTAGLCATSSTMSITVNQNVAPTFTQVAPICAGAPLNALPTTSNNSITGTWLPALNNAATMAYEFTPTAGLCATTAAMTITVNPNIAPTFTQVAAVCSGLTMNALPTTSNNGYTGNWSPALNNVSSTNYLFTPTAGLCATSTTMFISVITSSTPASYLINVPVGTTLNAIPGYSSSYNVYSSSNSNTLLTPSAVMSSGVYPYSITSSGCESSRATVTIQTYILPSINAVCGTTLSSVNQAIYCSNLAVATGYRFEVTVGSNVYVITSSSSVFTLTQLPGGAAFATTYRIRASAFVDGQYSPYGIACTTTTPSAPDTTQIIGSQCGTMLTGISTVLYCSQSLGATGYRFDVSTNGSTRTINTTSNSFQLTQLTGGVNYSTTYSIRVAIKYNGAYGNYGATCTVTTPAATFATTRLNAVHCGTALTSKWNVLYCGQVIGATAYRFTLTNGTTSLSYTNSSNYMQLGNVVGYALNTTYSVTVAVQINGGWGNEGASCSIKTPATTARQVQTNEDTLTVKAIPNPFETQYVLMAQGGNQTPFQVSVYDMLGKQVEQFSVEANELENRSLGTNYASGIYNVMIAQGDDQQVVRIIKK